MNIYQRGVGLIEVLVALVIFAIGVVGMAGLQLRTLSMSIDSTQRSVVIAKSQDLADRIRSSGAAPSAYVGTYNSDLCPTIPANICADGESIDATNCDTQQMAAFDVWDVLCSKGPAVNGGDSKSGLDGNVVQWTTVINCSGGCGGTGAQMSIATTWESRTADTNAAIANNNVTNADGSEQSAVTDSLTLSFIP